MILHHCELKFILELLLTLLALTFTFRFFCLFLSLFLKKIFLWLEMKALEHIFLLLLLSL